MSERFLRMICLLACLLLLGGCSASTPPDQGSMSLPVAVSLPYTAPVGDEGKVRTVSCALYLPSQDQSRLSAVYTQISVEPTREIADRLCEALFAYAGTDASQLPYAESLALMDSVEVAGRIAVVNLTSRARQLSSRQQFIVAQALANTLTQFGDISGIVLLVAGSPFYLDEENRTPAGVIYPNHTDDLYTLWNRAYASKDAVEGTGRMVKNALLYFPIHAGKGMICEDRTLAFASTDPVQIALTLCDALSAGSTRYEGCPSLPDLRDCLEEEITAETDGHTLRLHFHFADTFHQALLDHGITRSSFTAAFVCTMTTFIGGIESISITIGGDAIANLTPEGIYNGAGQTITFSDNQMRRSQFGNFLLSPVTLYFANAQGNLSACRRAIPWQQSHNLRFLLTQLLEGPQYGDLTQDSLTAVINNISGDELLGTGYAGDGTALCNFSNTFLERCQGLDANAEKRLVYAIVNTLTELRAVNGVCIFIEGVQPDTLLGSIYLPGVFLRNPDMIGT